MAGKEGRLSELDSIYDDGRTYTVQEVARIAGINAKSLRYYDEIGLLKPFRRDAENGYRYYTISQFYILEMLKYAKRLGLSTGEYRNLLISGEEVQNGDYSQTRRTLEDLLQRRREELAEVQAIVRDLERMEANLRILEANTVGGKVFYQDLPERCVYTVGHDPDSSFEETSLKMRATRYRLNVPATEEYGLLMDVGAAREGHQLIVKQFVVLDGDLPDSEHVMHLPAGRYASFLQHAMRPAEKMPSLAAWLADNPTDSPYLVADELDCFDSVAQIVHAVRVPPVA